MTPSDLDPAILEALSECLWIMDREPDCQQLRGVGYAATWLEAGEQLTKRRLGGKKRVVVLQRPGPDGAAFGEEVRNQLNALKWRGGLTCATLPDPYFDLDIVARETVGDRTRFTVFVADCAATGVTYKLPEDAKGTQDDDQPRAIRNDHGRLISCQHNALLWLAKHDYTGRIALDTFRQSIMVDAEPISDETIIEMVRQMEASEMIHWAEVHVRNAVISLGSRQAFSSVTRWLDGLVWDKKKRLRTFFADMYGAEVSDYTAACADVLFHSAVARAYQPGCQADVMVVLIGEQGIGKSKGIADLVPHPTWYTDDLGGDLYDRKAGEGLQGKWLIEFGEFARINRATLDVVKAFLSRRVDHYRPAYGRIAKDFPRQCIFIGTTNNPLPLQDLENRRFMPVHCPKDVLDIPPHRDQLWAEAVHRYKAGEPWWIKDKDLLKTVKERQEDARQHDEWEDVLWQALKLTDKITLTDAADRLGIAVDRLDKSLQTRLGLVMKAIGWTRKREPTAPRAYYWVREVKR